MILTRYEFLLKKRKDDGIKYCNDLNAFIECSNRMDDVYQNIDDCNPSRKRKILIVFDGMIADIMSNKEFQVIIKESFIRCRKLNISDLFFCAKRYWLSRFCKELQRMQKKIFFFDNWYSSRIHYWHIISRWSWRFRENILLSSWKL